MSILATLIGQSALLKARKFGKTKEQKRVIDFFANGESGGCLSSDLNMDGYLNLVNKKANSVDFKARAIEKIGIDEDQIAEIPPICLANFRFDSDCHSLLGKVKHSDQYIVVSSQYSISWLFFSETQMYVYTYIFDMMSNNVWETVREFFYTDITCFRTVHQLVERIQRKTKGCSGCLKATPLHADYDVDTLCITVPGEDYTVSMRNSADSVNSVYAARALIREKKLQK